MFSEPGDPETLDDQRVDTLVERLQGDALSEQDKVTITKVLRSYLYLIYIVGQTGARIRLVREFLFGKKKRPKNHDPVWVRDVRMSPQTGRQATAQTAAPKTEKPETEQTAEASQQPARKHR